MNNQAWWNIPRHLKKSNFKLLIEQRITIYNRTIFFLVIKL